MLTKKFEFIKVSSVSNPTKVAGALAAFLKEKDVLEMQAIGASAVNQAVKAIAITRGYLSPLGYNITCIPSFINVELEGEQRTAIRFMVNKILDLKED